MQNPWSEFLQSRLDQLSSQFLSRRRGGDMAYQEKRHEWLNFGSNDYLALRQNPNLIAHLQQALQSGWGSGASPVLSGHYSPHQQLEEALTELSRTDDAMVFSSGYGCHLGCLACLADQQCIVFSDQLNHASLIDGLRLGRAERAIYQHCDLADLERQLHARRATRPRALIVTESVFSMDGDHAPLVEIVSLAQRFDCELVVDEAHAIGVWGPRGGGLLEALNLTQRVLLKLGTLSKALGGIGGYAAGSQRVIDFLVNHCRSYIFSTAPPAVTMLTALAAVELMQGMHTERAKLLEISRYARARLSSSGWRVVPGSGPIVPLLVRTANRALQISASLRDQRVYVPAIRPPTVPANACRLRISLNSDHTKADIDRLVDVLAHQVDGSDE